MRSRHAAAALRHSQRKMVCFQWSILFGARGGLTASVFRFIFAGFRSKFRKVFPFNFNSSKDTKAVVSKEGEENYTKDLVNYLKSATLCVSGPALSANRKIIQSLIRPLEVPK